MAGGIYAVQGDGKLLEMHESRYESEAILQDLLARYPNLLAGDQIDSESPRRWLLIAREVGVPGEKEGPTRWSVDHLFVDQDAIPTIVEVKRSSDTRIRREVVGQMLDYAANGLAYWSVEELQARLRATCEEDNKPDEIVADFLSDEQGVGAFWQRLKTNLQAGRVRLVFVADEIPPDLRTVIEFLNSQMDPAEVFGVEIRQYQGGELRTLVPRVVGQTAQARQKKVSGSGPWRQWDEQTFFEDLARRRPSDHVPVARTLLDWARNQGLRIWWGRGKQDGSFFPILDHDGQTHWTFSVWTYGRIETQFQKMQTRPPFDAEEMRQALRRRLNAIEGIHIPEDGITRRPSIDLGALVDEARRKVFLDVLDWFVGTIRAT